MASLFDLAIFLVAKANRTGRDPLELGTKAARALKLNSSDAETLFMDIWLATKYVQSEGGTTAPDDEGFQGTPEYQLLQAI